MPQSQTETILRPRPRWSLNLNQEEVEGVRFLGPRTERWKINYIQLAKQSCSEANQPHLSPSPLSRKQKFSIENVKNWHLMNQLHNLPTSASSSCTQLRGFSFLPWVASTRLLWFLTGVKWKCTIGAHSFPAGHKWVWGTDLSYQEADRWTHRPASVSSRFVDSNFDLKSCVSATVKDEEKEDWKGLQSNQLSYLATKQNSPLHRG